jgi:RNA polymerase sigma-70 factor (ECF subfamily)
VANLGGRPEDSEALFREHASFIAGFVRRLGIPEQEVDDVVQQVFMTAHRRGFVEGAARPRTWLAEIALRVTSVAKRGWRRRRTTPDEEAVARATAGGTPYDAAATAESLARVQRALEALDVAHRAVFILFELAGESCEAIAASLAIPVGTVHSRLHAARARILAEYTRLGRSPMEARHERPAALGR